MTVIEWGDAIAPVLPADYLEVGSSRLGADDDDRLLHIRWVRPVAARRRRAALGPLAPWAPDGPEGRRSC